MRYLKERAGCKYRAGELAKRFVIGAEPLREVMNQLTDQGIVQCFTNSKGGNLYFIAKVPLLIPPVQVSEPGVAGSLSNYIATRKFKPYTPPAGFAERCRELYPEGHSLSANGVKS